jgi:hypothetical protein
VRTIFGREPALWLNLAAVVIYGAGLVLDLNADAQGILNGIAGLVASLIVAGFVRAEEWVPIVLGLFKLVIALLLALEVNLSAETQVVVMSLLTAVLALFTRTQVVAPVPPKVVARP